MPGQGTQDWIVRSANVINLSANLQIKNLAVVTGFENIAV
jgi:hypothetical protein